MKMSAVPKIYDLFVTITTLHLKLGSAISSQGRCGACAPLLHLTAHNTNQTWLWSFIIPTTLNGILPFRKVQPLEHAVYQTKRAKFSGYHKMKSAEQNKQKWTAISSHIDVAFS
eukprot:TRINITY_DN119236_c0_g1_i1.p1 TRINITY_DN119236_c0_g1~~TRINITY_DN119236_c0_g1_i1.p1  ORF type:complete len:114 (+),score=7.56 TRINITY_DN119236_c0_g1_i1:105-446(+)